MQRLINLYRELSRRKVTRVAAGYVVIVWALSLGFAELFPVFGLGDWAIRAFIAVGLLGLPLAVFLSWKYDLTSDGVVQDPMDFPSAPFTPQKLRSWGELRQEGLTPVPLTATWKDPESGERVRKTFSGAILIGRDETSDVCIVDQRVSRLHAVVWFEPAGWHVRDLDSSNGTFVSGQRIDSERRLASVAQLRLHAKGPVIQLESVDEHTLLTLHSTHDDMLRDS